MPNVLLGVTGSVAAIYTPELYAALKKAGFDVKVVATQSALHFFDAATLDPVDPTKPMRNRDVVILDADEWSAQGYKRGDPVLHIELRRWANALVIAPLDANTLGKLANGICDNCLTCVWRAWDGARPVVLAPAMNTLMWEHPVTDRHLRQLESDAGNLQVIPPQTKKLACDDVGMGAMAGIDEIVTLVQGKLRHT